MAPTPYPSGIRYDTREAVGATCMAEAPEPPSQRGNNFSKGLLWSPDGSTLLAANDDSTMRLYNFDDEALLTGTQSTGSSAPGQPRVLEPYAQGIEGGPILDFCFFPAFSQNEPASCCYITSSQDHPIHLCEAHTGALCNTYRPFNTVDEVCHAYSICFSPDGGRILGGFSQYIRVFDLQRPGRQTENWLLSTRKGKGQKGIIGAITPCPWSPGLYAAGSYNRTICLYKEGCKGKPVGWLQDREKAFDMGGVTQLAFASDWMLLSGHRKDSWLRVWDLRMLSGDGDGSQALLCRLPRPIKTHQRFWFGVRGASVSTGTSDGDVFVYNLGTFEEEHCIKGAQGSACVAAMLHPQREDVLATSGGGRIFPNYDFESESSEEEASTKRAKIEKKSGDPRLLCDNSVRLWRLGKGDSNNNSSSNNNSNNNGGGDVASH